MLKHIKRQLSELTETLMKARPEIEAAIEQEKEEALINMLADAQEAAVALGNMLEKTEGETEPAALMIGMLEEYCETLWKITQEHAADGGRLEAIGKGEGSPGADSGAEGGGLHAL